MVAGECIPFLSLLYVFRPGAWSKRSYASIFLFLCGLGSAIHPLVFLNSQSSLSYSLCVLNWCLFRLLLSPKGVSLLYHGKINKGICPCDTADYRCLGSSLKKKIKKNKKRTRPHCCSNSNRQKQHRRNFLRPLQSPWRHHRWTTLGSFPFQSGTGGKKFSLKAISG